MKKLLVIGLALVLGVSQAQQCKLSDYVDKLPDGTTTCFGGLLIKKFNNNDIKNYIYDNGSKVTCKDEPMIVEGKCQAYDSFTSGGFTTFCFAGVEWNKYGSGQIEPKLDTNCYPGTYR